MSRKSDSDRSGRVTSFPETLGDSIHEDSSKTTNELQLSVSKKVEENEKDVFGEGFNIFDELSPDDKLWRNREFKRQISNLGPDIFQNPRLAAKVEPFKLQWAYGFNKDASVINLCQSTHHRIVFFNVTQCGALYDIKQNKMEFLQGHPNKVIAISSTHDGRFLTTADSGPDNIIIIWQRSNISPAMIYFDPYEGRNILSIAISPLGTYLVSIGESGEDDIKIDLRIWGEGKEIPEETSDKHGNPLINAISQLRKWQEYFLELFLNEILDGVDQPTDGEDKDVTKDSR
ncbi:hypothetical protein HHI36_009307 [Cryptolaemus montrouzieri]|uniref:Uncharacterized protein n=1 Tax=Cryptolaemus montrouzieri TaxID=559131 RepID=A0ABD2MVV7_9CUCU